MSGIDLTFNVALGEVAERVDGGAGTWRIMFLEAVEGDDALADHDDIASLLGASNTESAVASRQALSNVFASVDDVANERSVSADDVTFTPAAGNTIVKTIIYHDPDGTDTDSQNVPATAHKDEWTPDGTQRTIPLSGGFQTVTPS